MSDEEGNKGRQSKEERAAMKNAARSQRSSKARALLAGLINEQHKIEIDPAKITSTKYVRELGLKFVPSDEQNFPWRYISTSQISSQDLAMLEAAISNAKVTAVKDDMYNAAAAFRSRSSISTPSRPNLSPTHSFSFPPHPHDPHSNPPDSYRGHPPSLPPLQTSQPPPHSPHSHSRLNSLAEASSAQASATSAHPSSANPGHHWAGATAAASTSTHIGSPPEAPPTGPMPQPVANEARSATAFTPSNPRKRMYPFDTIDSHVDEEETFRIKIPRKSIKHILDQENAAHISRIRDLEGRVAELERDTDRQNKELHRLRIENERLRKDLTLQGGDELERLRMENEHLKALGRKLFD
ncbi:hypothetical protein DRE_02375 [Drechslerella stenobrocha 248]|uniref:Uncharacterized protein n=1 Tax=Drechslerella stenobrocha 248 TaxID=1043628 RepID=W7HVP7_9PEZI|nr:hypothetical protein DRE_02375 [Drechslerella stenobrocha 248]